MCCCADRLAWLAHTLELAPTLAGAEGQFWWGLNTQNGIVGKARAGSVRGAPKTTDRGVAEQTGGLWLATAGCRWRPPLPLRPALAGEMSHGHAGERLLINAPRALFVSSDITEGFSSPPSAGCARTEAGTPASCRPTSQLAFSPDVSVLAFRLFLFHAAITYVCSQGSLSTHFRNRKEHV